MYAELLRLLVDDYEVGGVSGEILAEYEGRSFGEAIGLRLLAAVHGMVLSGVSPDGRLVEMIELPQHPYFVGCQFHPEFKSRPSLPHPLFARFVKAALEGQMSQKKLHAV